MQLFSDYFKTKTENGDYLGNYLGNIRNYLGDYLTCVGSPNVIDF